MKIYTRTGDDGTTALLGNARVPKSDPRFDCIGTLDELSAVLGSAGARSAALAPLIHPIQSDLFTIGAHLAAASESARSNLAALSESSTARLESEIDAAEEKLPALKNFILPGGTPAAADLHVARAICRRAERLLVALAERQPVPPVALRFMNRLSDWLFVQARRANQLANVDDIIWRMNQTSESSKSG